MASKIIFPMGIATGAAFCNRVKVKEKEILAENIAATRHTVLLAPRRYGKTSLVTEVIRNLNQPFCEMDFLLTATIQAVEATILDKVGSLLNTILPRTKKARNKVLHLFKRLNPEIVLSSFGQKVVLHPPFDEEDHETTICDTLLNLDKAAIASKKHLIVFMDEFQQIGQLKDHHVVEASIRHAAERSQNVSYIFSGSNRHMLQQMFSEKSRPFYKFCMTMNINRIEQQKYIDFIQFHGKKKWKRDIAESVLIKIFQLSECHPYYVNLICNHFWGNNIFPTKNLIDIFWNDYVRSEKSVIASELSALSNNQKTLIRELANRPANQPYGNKFLLRTRLTIASQKEAINKLLRKDFIFEDKLGFLRVLDPAIKAYIKMD